MKIKQMLNAYQSVTGASTKRIVIGKAQGQTAEAKIYSLICPIAIPLRRLEAGDVPIITRQEQSN